MGHAVSDDEILEVVAHEIKRDRSDLRLDATPLELDLESLDIIELVFALEERFEIELPWNANQLGNDEAEQSFATIGDLVAGVQQAMRSRSSGA